MINIHLHSLETAIDLFIGVYIYSPVSITFFGKIISLCSYEFIHTTFPIYYMKFKDKKYFFHMHALQDLLQYLILKVTLCPD